MIRVLRLREEDPVVWQKALLLSEAEEVSLQTLAPLTRLAAQIALQQSVYHPLCILVMNLCISLAARVQWSRYMTCAETACHDWLTPLHSVQVFSGSRSTRTEEQVLATSALVQEWKRMQGDESEEEQAAQPCDSSKPIEGDCPICYDEMHPGGSTAQVGCRITSTTCRAS